MSTVRSKHTREFQVEAVRPAPWPARVAVVVALLVGAAVAQTEERADPATLLHDLQHATSWIRQADCARALAATRVADDEVLAALLRHVTTSSVPALRAACLDAYATLRPTAAQDLLAAVGRGDFDVVDHAADAFERLGDRATAVLVDEVQKAGPAAGVAKTVLLRRGWLDVPELERAGLHELAERALVAGAVHRCDGAQESQRLQAKLARAPAPTKRVPDIEWVSGFGHGSGIELCRALAAEEGLQVTSIGLHEPRDGPRSWPVCTRFRAGSWLIASVCIERTIASSSAHCARCGSRSLIQAPQAPRWANLRLVFWMRRLCCPEVIVVMRWPWRTESGSSWPCQRGNAGLWSNRSSCDGAPTMCR